jgi:hypothetical protein
MDPSRTRASRLTCEAIRSAAVVMAMAMGMMCVCAAQERPAYRAQRFEEDWSFLRDPSRRDDPWDGWKYVPLPWHGWYVTVAGEERLRYERLDHPGFGAGPTDTNGYLLHRALLSADLHLGRRVRVFAELQSGLALGRAGGPRPTDRDRLDVNQAFVDVGLGGSLTVRAGRQEVAFGSGRLLSPGESLNVRRAFEGVRLTVRHRGVDYNGLLVQPVTTAAGVFDNGAAAGQSLWGVGLTSTHPWWRSARWSAYYLGLDRRRASFVQGSGAERRHTVGTRTWRATSGWDVNGEAIVQWGRFAGAPIRAWALSGDLGTTLRHRWRPRLGVRADVASGDRDATDARLESFNPLFPSATAYSGSSGLIGASNIIDVTPTVRVSPTTALTLTVEAAVYRRLQRGDGVYTVFVTPLRPPGPSPSRAIGVAPSAAVTVQVDRHLTWTTAASLFVPGTYLDSVPPARPVQYATTVLTYRF